HFAVRLDESAAAKLSAHAGKPILFGLRPEDIAEQWVAGEAGRDCLVEAAVEIVELLGAEAYLYLSTAAHSFVARVRAQSTLAAQQRVSVAFDMRQARF